MAWEQRGGRRYYYRARKVGGHVVKEYVGRGFLAELDAAEAEGARAEVERLRVEAEHRINEAKDNDQELDAIDRAIAKALQEAGLHRPNRGQWRRRREG